MAKPITGGYLPVIVGVSETTLLVAYGGYGTLSYDRATNTVGNALPLEETPRQGWIMRHGDRQEAMLVFFDRVLQLTI